MKKIIEIKSNTHRAQIDCFGAELISFYSFNNGREFIWQQNEKWWKRSAPVLFPMIGCLKDSSYSYEGKSYQISKHGFARDCDFSVESSESDKATFKLIQNDTVKEMFPFNYELYVDFKISGNKISIQYRVLNKDDKDISFAIGSHPAFNLFLSENTTHSDYNVKFNSDEKSYYLLQNDLLDCETPISDGLNSSTVNLSEYTFSKDALIFKDITSNKVELSCDKLNHKVIMTFKDVPYFGVWSPKGAPFVCLEPWCGAPDSVNPTAEIGQKPGFNTIAPNIEYTTGLEIEVH